MGLGFPDGPTKNQHPVGVAGVVDGFSKYRSLGCGGISGGDAVRRGQPNILLVIGKPRLPGHQRVVRT